MSKRTEIQAQITNLQAQLAVLNSVPEDTFHFGDVAIFASNTAKWHYIKVDEEAWRPINGGAERPLSEWILNNKDANIGYFEVYIMKPQASPIWASA